jgi:hypothetical protein
VLEQTLVPHDVVVVDDGSNDATPDLATSWWFKSHVRYIRIQHRGAAAARNTGWRAVSGELVAFLDADDWWLPPKLERQLAVLGPGSPDALVYCDTMRVHTDGSPIDRWSDHFRPVYGDVLSAMLVKNRVQTSTVVVSRAILDAVGGFRQDMMAWEDVDLWTRIAAHYPFQYVPEVLACYRMGAGLSTRHRLMAEGRLLTAESMGRDLSGGQRSGRGATRALADARGGMGVVCYLDGEMTTARRWFRQSWRTDPTAALRERALETYAKSLLGNRAVTRLRNLRHRRA